MAKSQGDRKGPPEKDRSTDVCFYGPMCTRPNCKYTHETPEGGVNVEPCRLDLAGLCRATAETCKKRHVQGVERTWLIQKMARTPCRHALECRTKNCLFKHPLKLGDYDRMGKLRSNIVNGGDANPQQASRYGSEQSGRDHFGAGTPHPPLSPPIAMPVGAPYQWPPHPLYVGYPMYSYYPQASYFMGMVPSTMHYNFGDSYPNVPAYQPSSILAPPLYAYDSGSSGAYPRSISISESMYGEGTVLVPGGSQELSPLFLPSSPTSSTGIPHSVASFDEKNEPSPSIPLASSEETPEDPEKAMLHDDAHDASSSLTCVVIEATTSVLSADDDGDDGEEIAGPEAGASTEPC